MNYPRPPVGPVCPLKGGFPFEPDCTSFVNALSVPTRISVATRPKFEFHMLKSKQGNR